MEKFIIEGGKPLKGTVRVAGSKNAALPLIAATLLTSEECILRNVPDIEDVRTMLKIMEFLGAEYEFEDNVLKIQTKEIKQTEISHELVCRLRASILFLAPLLAREGEVKLAFPGGCILGKRSVSAHLYALGKLGG
ncbi:MAG TPA: UDP-N-acetylglucosamine 1-carboxyvinyltransferase, partial [Methanomicrobia archaeon]|nr:UDP-N-acetylglucosamine 1-carboxyvinyltransferase [Methanomicrobia archaeon]